MSKVYEIVGTYRGKSEVIDSTEDKSEAKKYIEEYRSSFGKEWSISMRERNIGRKRNDLQDCCTAQKREV